MVKFYNRLNEENLKAKLILQVHDELIVDCPQDEREKVLEIMKDVMIHAVDLKVDMKIDINSADNWYDANKKIIVVCGNIASGKSTVCKRIREKGFVVVDLDEITHQIYEQGTDLYYKLIDEFGEGILDENSNIDRKKLSNIVFNSKTLLKKLEELTHTDIILRVVKKN